MNLIDMNQLASNGPVVPTQSAQNGCPMFVELPYRFSAFSVYSTTLLRLRFIYLIDTGHSFPGCKGARQTLLLRRVGNRPKTLAESVQDEEDVARGVLSTPTRLAFLMHMHYQ